jgi:hypothetical protein
MLMNLRIENSPLGLIRIGPGGQGLRMLKNLREKPFKQFIIMFILPIENQ